MALSRTQSLGLALCPGLSSQHDGWDPKVRIPRKEIESAHFLRPGPETDKVPLMLFSIDQAVTEPRWKGRRQSPLLHGRNVKKLGGQILKLPWSASDHKLCSFFTQNSVVPSKESPKHLVPSRTGVKSRSLSSVLLLVTDEGP